MSNPEKSGDDEGASGEGASMSAATTAVASAAGSPADDGSPASSASLSISFSSGNPRIEEIRGIIYLFPDAASSPSPAAASNLPVGRKPWACVLTVPNHMTYADFFPFCGAFVPHMLEMQIVRKDGVDDQYSVIIKFDNQDSTDGFYRHFNQKPFTSLEIGVCHVLYIVDVQYTGSRENAHGSVTSAVDQPTCPVCLERLDQGNSGILTTICNHSFHCSCISEWTDSSCPVCRYCQQEPQKSNCFICGTYENLWICVICGFVGCGRYVEGHAVWHWKETQHCYSLELETQLVWDYVGDNYVRRLIQSKTDGKFVELNFPCSHTDDGCAQCEFGSDSVTQEVLYNSKVESIDKEFNLVLASQLEQLRNNCESRLFEEREEREKEISAAVEKARSSKLQKLTSKINKCIKEKKFLDDINEDLTGNQEIWKAKIEGIEKRKQASERTKDKKIEALEEQLRQLMLCLEGEDPNAAPSLSPPASPPST